MSALNYSSTDPHAIPAAALQNAPLASIRSEDDVRRFSSVVLPYLADAYALARCLTGSHADSEDVVQDACLRALHGIGSFSNGNARAWVLTIVRRTAYDWLHKNRPATLVSVDDLEDLERAPVSEQDVATPETAILAKEEKTALEAAIAMLPPHCRETLVLRDVHGLTYREISDLAGTSIGTVMSRLFRARRHLIAIMAEKRGTHRISHQNGHPARLPPSHSSRRREHEVCGSIDITVRFEPPMTCQDIHPMVPATALPVLAPRCRPCRRKS
jgi:RNA polymerase sigma factor (sigma-70 family)